MEQIKFDFKVNIKPHLTLFACYAVLKPPEFFVLVLCCSNFKFSLSKR